jgi:putative FmdB family regulatory protein
MQRDGSGEILPGKVMLHRGNFKENYLERRTGDQRSFNADERRNTMPIYEYLCLSCNKPFSFLVGVIADSGEPECTRCAGKKLRKLI